MKKLTPKQAFEHLQAVVLTLKGLRPSQSEPDSILFDFVYPNGDEGTGMLLCTNIDWRTYQKWPEEPGTWRAPVLPGDAGKECRVRDFVVDKWQTVTLSGYSNLQGNYCWIDDTETGWALCEVFEPAPIRPARKARTRASKKTRKSAR